MPCDSLNFAFLHGGGQGSWVWDQAIRALRSQAGRKDLGILALDVPGCGTKRERATAELTLQAVAEELVGDIKTSGLRDVVLVGHSQAGQAMALMVGLKPGLFRRLIYVSCSIPLRGQSVIEMIGKGAQGTNPREVGWPAELEGLTADKRFAVLFCNDMLPQVRDDFLARLGHDQWPLATYAFKDWDYTALGAVPSTFVSCRQDRILPLAWQEVFAQRFQCERSVSIDAGHQAMITRPDALTQILRDEAAADRA